MNYILNRDLEKVSDWSTVNGIDFNARKPQYSVLTYRREEALAHCTNFDVINIKEADTLDVLGIKIQADVQWNDNVF